jgi:hypothetical protein
LGDEDITRKYYPGGGGNLGTGTFIPDAFEAYQTPIGIDIRHGDRLFSELELPRIDLMKVDVEGFEAPVFRGLKDRIRRDRPPILMEMGDRCRAGFGSREAFRNSFYEGAAFAEVAGRRGCAYTLKPFRYEASHEALVVPPELMSWVASQVRG